MPTYRRSVIPTRAGAENLPLVAIVPLADLVLLNALTGRAARTLLLAFLIAGPIVFRLAGTPL